MKTTLLSLSALCFSILIMGLIPTNAQTVLYVTGGNMPGQPSIGFEFAATGNLYSGSGANSIFSLTGISGSVNENGDMLSITGLAPNGSPGQVGTLTVNSVGPVTFDNLLSLASPFVDTNGLAFYLSNGNLVNLYFQGYVDDYYDITGYNPGYVNMDVSLTPEPATLLLFGTGLLCVGFAIRRQTLVS